MSAIKLPQYQRNWLEDDSRFAAGMFPRQAGKTFISCGKIVDHCIGTESQGGRTRWVILSRGERQAKEAMDEGIKRHLHAYGIAAKSISESFEVSSKALEVELPGGSRISALPANPDTARGFSANVLLDEFAFHKDSSAIWRALFPVISRNGLMLRVVSTPNGKGNKFYELMTGGGVEELLRQNGRANNGVWSLHYCDIYRAVREGLERNIDELREGLRDPDTWAQEFELRWLDDASAWISFELMSKCESPYAGDWSQYAGGPCYVGVDIATRRDLFVIWVLERVGSKLITREVIAEQRIAFAQQDALLDDVVNRYDVRQIFMDKTGMGEKPVEDAQRRYGAHKAHGVHFTNQAKQHLATQGKKAFEDALLVIPADNAIRYDIHKLKRVTGPTGLARFIADSDSSGHADRAWALFLAIDAARNESVPFEYTPVPNSPHTRSDINAENNEWWNGQWSSY